MKKILLTFSVLSGLLCFISVTEASDKGHGRGHAYGHYKKHGDHEGYTPPPAGYYNGQPRPQTSDRRSTEGLVGGAVGSALGYEISNGDPVASGLGAAAGAYIGNKVNNGR